MNFARIFSGSIPSSVHDVNFKGRTYLPKAANRRHLNWSADGMCTNFDVKFVKMVDYRADYTSVGSQFEVIRYHGRSHCRSCDSTLAFAAYSGTSEH
jgi:hypothetical protein